MTDLYGLFEDPDEQARRRARDMADMITGQRRQAADMRNLSGLSSLGANPLLRGLQQSSMQAANMLGNESSEGSGYLAQAGGQRANRAFQRDMDALQAQRMDANALRQRGWQVEDRRARERLEREAMGLKAAQDKAAAEAAAKGDISKFEDDLRGEYTRNPTVKSFQEAKIAFDKVQRAAGDPSAAGDLALIFGYMKTLDPGSTVREGEFANAQNAGGVDQRVAATYNRVLNGERLTPDQRADFVKSAQGQFAAHQAAFEQVADQYGGLAKARGGDPSKVAIRFGASPAASSPAPVAEVLPKDASGQPTLAPDDEVQQMLKWARENPDEPESKAILEAFGGAK